MKLFPYIITLLLLIACQSKDLSKIPMEYIGRENCVSCHESAAELFKGSHHDMAMDVATSEFVLGSFNNDTLVYFEDTAIFFMEGDVYFARYKNSEGRYENFKISYVFGYTPLQQYLVEFPDGRLQVLPLCWDANPADKGGQRWFHIYPDEYIRHDDVLHWTGLMQNWNYMCAECHSTDLNKNFDIETNTYNTTWNEIDVSCEACHGPGSRHYEWARLEEKGKEPEGIDNYALFYRLREDTVDWVFDLEKGNAYRAEPRTDHTQIEMCARCHSRRSIIWDDYVHGKSLLNTHYPSILFSHLYHVDGQIMDEDYVYGSFIQSKMYHQGVTCTDCHDPHSLKVRSLDNLLCSRCHLTAKYDTPDHHHHNPDSAGASCFDCHMPTNTYMVVDPRRDHSIRIPRPDISLETGAPNACNKCHTDKSVQWADKAFRKWYGNKYDTINHFGFIFADALKGEKAVFDELVKMRNVDSLPDIVRATSLAYLANNYSINSPQTFIETLGDPSPLVRSTSLRILQNYDVSQYMNQIYPLLGDPVRAVRLEAARILAPVPPQYYDPSKTDLVEKAIDEFITSVKVNLDQPGANINMGVYYAARGMYAEAEKAYKNALMLDSNTVTAYVNLADLYRLTKEDAKGEKMLQMAINIDPTSHQSYYALALLYVRQKQLDNAVANFRKAVELEPDNERYMYTYAIALNSNGNSEEAVKMLQKALTYNNDNQEVIFALAAIYRDMNQNALAREYAMKLLKINPENEQAKQFIRSLK